jgi:hypothetical protein
MHAHNFETVDYSATSKYPKQITTTRRRFYDAWFVLGYSNLFSLLRVELKDMNQVYLINLLKNDIPNNSAAQPARSLMSLVLIKF